MLQHSQRQALGSKASPSKEWLQERQRRQQQERQRQAGQLQCDVRFIAQLRDTWCEVVAAHEQVRKAKDAPVVMYLC